MQLLKCMRAAFPFQCQCFTMVFLKFADFVGRDNMFSLVYLSFMELHVFSKFTIGHLYFFFCEFMYCSTLSLCVGSLQITDVNIPTTRDQYLFFTFIQSSSDFMTSGLFVLIPIYSYSRFHIIHRQVVQIFFLYSSIFNFGWLFHLFGVFFCIWGGAQALSTPIF